MADYSIEVSIPNVGPQGPQGEVGPVGPANELTLGEITTGDPGTEAEATISGTPPNQVLDLVLPRGDTGAQGNPGPTGTGGVGVVPAPIYATMQEAVEDGITFGGVFRHTSGSVFWVEEPDPDAATFIAASGATDVWNIQKFVQGVKTLGLWDDMVCWPLRSAQNAGTGTLAYSLGGLGTFNGALVNSPTWSANGAVFAATNRHIQIPDNASLRDTRSALLAFNSNDTALNQFLIEIQTQAADGIYVGLRFNGQNFASVEQGIKYGVTRGGTQVQNLNATRPINLNTFRTGAFTADDSTDNVFENGAIAANGARTGLAAINPTGTVTIRQLFGASSDMTGAFAMASTAKWTDQQVADLHNLYKSTLGIGLSLP
jgi:hypothetical protein